MIRPLRVVLPLDDAGICCIVRADGEALRAPAPEGADQRGSPQRTAVVTLTLHRAMSGRPMREANA